MQKAKTWKGQNLKGQNLKGKNLKRQKPEKPKAWKGKNLERQKLGKAKTCKGNLQCIELEMLGAVNAFALACRTTDHDVHDVHDDHVDHDDHDDHEDYDDRLAMQLAMHLAMQRLGKAGGFSILTMTRML